MLLHQGIEATSFSEGGASVAGTALTDSPGSLGTALTAAAVDMGAIKQYANSSSISAGGVRRALQVTLEREAWEGMGRRVTAADVAAAATLGFTAAMLYIGS